jgi:hypothetical protein
VPSVNRAGWTLHEMLISLVVTAGVMALASQIAIGHMRFFRNGAERATLRGNASEAGGIAASVLRGISSQSGDVVSALDSAIEVRMATGTAIACSSTAGSLTIPQSAGPAGYTPASFSEPPEPGDWIFALETDSAGESWSAHLIRESVAVSGACAALHPATAGRLIRIAEPRTFLPGTALRFARVFRLSLYRSSDGRWYLGGREWNAESQQFNTIQPIAGPLAPYHAEPTRTGLLFSYLDATGEPLTLPIDRFRIAMIRIVARASSGAFSDSTSVTVALRNGE